MIRAGNKEWEISVHRDFESIIEAWKATWKEGFNAIIQVGFSRISPSEFEYLCDKFPGKMLMSGGAKYVFDRVGESTKDSVGVVGGLPVYVALNGWGYNVSEQDLLTPELAKQSIAVYADKIGSQSNPSSFTEWMELLKSEFPEEYEGVKSFGIIDESTYLRHEHLLDRTARIAIGGFRFKVLSRSIDVHSPSQVVKISPPWLKKLRVSALNMPIRPAKVLSRAGIEFVSEIENLDDSRLLKFRNLGKTSVTDISIALLSQIFPGESYFAILNKLGKENPETPTKTESQKKKRLIPDQAELDSLDFKTALDNSISSLGTTMCSIMKMRMGLSCKKSTLQEIADSVRLSRERVRQLEAKAIKFFRTKQVWQERLGKTIINALKIRSTGLPIVGLEVIDPWFKTISNCPESFEYALEYFIDPPLHLLNLDTGIFVSMISSDEFEKLVETAVEMLEAISKENWPQSKVKEAILTAIKDKAGELGEEVFQAATRWAVFSKASGNSEPILVAVGKNMEAQVEAILFEADRPLHFSEIHTLIQNRGRNADIRRIHIAAQKVGHLFARGIYGLEKHLLFTEEEADAIVNAVENCVQKNPGRQWHSDELCTTLFHNGIELEDRLNQYTLSIILKRSKSLINLRRHVWVLNTGKHLSTGDRIDKMQAVEAMVRNNGAPMSGIDIKKQLLIDRGLGKIFQIIPNESLLRVQDGVWGLIDRDVPYNSDVQKEILDRLRAYLESSGTGIHISEIPGALMDCQAYQNHEVDPVLITSLAQRDNNFSLTTGDYLYLSKWEGPRRLRPVEAVQQVLSRAGQEGIGAVDLRTEVANLLGREIPEYAIYSPLRIVGAQWNEYNRRWILHSDESDI